MADLQEHIGDFTVESLPPIVNPALEIGILADVLYAEDSRKAFYEIKRERFADPVCQSAYEIMRESYLAGREVDLVTTGSRLSKTDPGAFTKFVRLLDSSREDRWKEKDEDRERKGFYFSKLGDLLHSVQDIPWIIKGVIQESALVCLFGPSATYKSFLALSWAVSIATGEPWNGYEVKRRGPVIMLVGEGRHGYPKRALAYQIATGIDLTEAPLFISSMPAQILDRESSQLVADHIRALAESVGDPVAIIIDTLARNIGAGDENSSKDISEFLSNLDIYLGDGCTKIIVHHVGHQNKERARGSYALMAALDIEYRMDRNADGTVELHNTKAKDFEQWQKAMKFTPRQVIVAEGEDGPVTSLYLKHAGDAVRQKKALTKKMKKALELLKEMEQENGEEGVTLTEWRGKCDETKTYARQKTYELFKKFEQEGYITTNFDFVTSVT